MKKLFDKLSNIGCLLPFIIGGLLPIVMMCVWLWKACNGNIGYFILNILMAPLILIGGINVIRGFCAVLEKDGDKFEYEKGWKISLYMLITIASYFALAMAIVQWDKYIG